MPPHQSPEITLQEATVSHAHTTRRVPLDSRQIGRLQDGLLAAFKLDDLRQMLLMELNVNLDDYRSRIAPMFDSTYAALLTDLSDSGLLDSTLVIASGEFGRSPRINIRGGRDHWAGAWTALFAGAGVQGGQIIGATDRLGMEPSLRPVHASAIANTIQAAMGHSPVIRHQHGQPIHELFGSRASS